MKYMIAKFTKCPEDSEGLLKCLQGKSATEILLLYEIQYHVSYLLSTLRFVNNTDCQQRSKILIGRPTENKTLT